MSVVKKNNRFAFPSLLNDLFMDERLDVLNSFRNNVPQVNIKESETNFMIELAAPGLKKEDFNIDLDDHVLTIATEQKSNEETKDEAHKYTRREFSYTAFTRSFTLPDEVKIKDITARYTDGILAIEVPKDIEAKLEQKRTIAIS